MFDALQLVLTSAGLEEQITSFLGIPVIAGAVLAGLAVAMVVLGVRGLKKITWR